uniref:hypothetical protein n=1 Tax=Flavobacterium sp. TaxID=239 RepID=UPI0037501AEE
MFYSVSAFSQNYNGIESNYSPGGKLETIFDNYGNKYQLSDVTIGPHKSRNTRDILESRTTCNPGIFTLHFEDGSGMEGTSIAESSRRAVLCQVFQDLSNMINTPLKTTGNRVNIWVRNINEIPNVNAQTLGLATGFYNVAQLQTPMNSNGGIADNEIWKTIHAGVDSFTNVSSLIVSTSGNATSGGSFYHGMMAFNFTNFNWNTNMNLTTTTLHDLYTVALHEVTHALGFASLINVNGASNFTTGYNYYSRYDTFLRDHNGNRLISLNNECSMYDNGFINSTGNLHPGCTDTGNLATSPSNNSECLTTLEFLGSNTIPIPIYTSKCFEIGSSLSHFEDQCYTSSTVGATNGNDEYFVMSNANAAGTIKRFLKPEERTALCDIGYSLRTTYGGTAALSSFNYGGTSCDGTRVAGINDGLESGTPIFFGNASQPILITDILLNDANYNFGNSSIASNDIANLRFECLQDVYYDELTTTVTPAIGNSSTVITFQSSQTGLHLLRYVPFDSVTGNRGNITYVYVFVVNENTCGIPNNCNIVINGNLEQHIPNIGNNGVNGVFTGLVCSVNSVRNTPDYYSGDFNLPSPSLVPIQFGCIGLTDPTIGNNSFVGFYLDNTFTGGCENLRFNLKEPLTPNTDYEIKFLVAKTSFNTGTIRFQALLTNNVLAQGFNFNNLNFQILHANSFLGNTTCNWQEITINFNSGVGGQNFLYLGSFVPDAPPNCNLCATNSWWYMDNVSLTPVIQGQFNLPAQICQTTTLDLANYLGNIPQNGVFSGNGVSLVNGVYFLNPNNLALGSHTITYTYTDNLGCPPITLSDDFDVVANCLTPYISQVYCESGDNTFIEVKNPSTTESIIAGSCFLNFYEDG